MDDYGHAGHHHADLVLNQNLDPPESLVPRAGQPYTPPAARPPVCVALLRARREFRRWQAWAAAHPGLSARKVLVTLGGADPPKRDRNAGARRPWGNCGRRDMEVVVLVGARANPHRARASRRRPATCRGVRLPVNAADMPGLMAWADGAVAAAGSTSWELLFMGLPSCVLVLADNQAALGPAAGRVRAPAINLGPAAALEPGPLADVLGGPAPRRAPAPRIERPRPGPSWTGRAPPRVVERMWTSSGEGT